MYPNDFFPHLVAQYNIMHIHIIRLSILAFSLMIARYLSHTQTKPSIDYFLYRYEVSYRRAPISYFDSHIIPTYLLPNM
jgi:hypothetical protein